MKPRIKIYDTAFAHSQGGSFGTGDLNIHPTHFEWYRGNDVIGDIAVITESCFHEIDLVKENIKIALIMEPPCIQPKAYELISKSEFRNKFDFILTHQKNLLAFETPSLHPMFFLYKYAGCWINQQDHSIHPKTKDISIIASKKVSAPGHILRHSAVSVYSKYLTGHTYGNGYKFVQNKLEALKDYRFSIVIENEISETWFTEKLIDCFVTGTVPIYWGPKSIGNYFNPKGILQFETLAGLMGIIPFANAKKYESMLPAIEENFNLAKKFTIPEDLLWNKFFKPIFF